MTDCADCGRPEAMDPGKPGEECSRALVFRYPGIVEWATTECQTATIARLKLDLSHTRLDRNNLAILLIEDRKSLRSVLERLATASVHWTNATGEHAAKQVNDIIGSVAWPGPASFTFTETP